MTITAMAYANHTHTLSVLKMSDNESSIKIKRDIWSEKYHSFYS